MDNIFQKINKVMNDVKYLMKDDKVVTNAKTGASYKAISEEKVTSELRKAMIKHGIVIIPIELPTFELGELDNTTRGEGGFGSTNV